MKYTIFLLIKGEAGVYQQRLLYEIATRFGVSKAVQRRPPAHITMKYSFETEDISVVERCVEEFCSRNSPASFVLSGVECFGREVIFLDVKESARMRRMYEEFIALLKEKTTISFGEFDGVTRFHSTVARNDISEVFDDIWSFVSDQEPFFELSFDNLAIMKLVNGVWQVHKEYRIN